MQLKDEICEAVQGAGVHREGWDPCFVSLISVNKPGEVTKNTYTGTRSSESGMVPEPFTATSRPAHLLVLSLQ